MRCIVLLLAALCVALSNLARAAEAEPLELEMKILLGEVKGRIDHFAFDLGRQRLFVAELGNDSVGVVDLKAKKVIHRIAGLKEPQGVGYASSTDTLYVANAGDGSVHLFQGTDLTPNGRIDLRDDADNIRVDPKGSAVFIGYGSGALAIIDPSTRTKIADIPLKAHPEAFQLDIASGRVFANVPDARQIAVADIGARKQVSSWPLKDAAANFPMTIDDDGHRVIVVTRNPAKLIAYSADGRVEASLSTCGDADDVFVDTKRHRLYVSCGEGVVDVLERRNDGYSEIARVATRPGARTSFFVPSIDRFVVGVRANSNEPASLWVFRPRP
jgi:YVTN family beta-propeller protein